MNRGTWVAMAGCLVTMALLAGVVTWAESRLPGYLHDDCREEKRLLEADRDAVKRIGAKIDEALAAHPKILGPTAREEGWRELVDSAGADIEQALARYGAEVAPLLEKNARDDEVAVEGLLEELGTSREDAMKSLGGLEQRIKELSAIVDRAQKSFEGVALHLRQLKELAGQTGGRVESLIEAHPAVRGLANGRGWPRACKWAASQADALAKEHADLAEMLAQPNVEKAKQLLAKLDELEARRGAVSARISSLRTRVDGLRDFLDKRDDYVAKAKADALALEQLPVGELGKQVEGYAASYPFNAAEIRRRGDVVLHLGDQSRELAADIERMAKLPLQDVDPQAFYRRTIQLSKLRAKAKGQLSAMARQLDQLDHGYVRFLTDMEIKEGYEVTFHQEIKTLLVGKDLDNQLSGAWKKVSEADYKRHEGHLGMALESKALGYFDDQKQTKVSPAGFGLIGHPSFGAWEQERWVFGDKAHPVERVFWNAFYAPVKRADHKSWRLAPKEWYGADDWGHALYGSQGSLTRKIYASSKFVRSDGWKNTRYKKTGGKFRGTRYEKKPVRRSTVVVGGGYRRSSSGPRYRSSSSSSSQRRSGFSWGK